MDYFEGQCTYCSKVFTCKETLEKHKLHVHYIKSAAHDCGECGKTHKRNPHVKKTMFETFHGQIWNHNACQSSHYCSSPQ